MRQKDFLSQFVSQMEMWYSDNVILCGNTEAVKSMKYFVGIDIGSTCAKTIVMNEEKQILHRLTCSKRRVFKLYHILEQRIVLVLKAVAGHSLREKL